MRSLRGPLLVVVGLLAACSASGGGGPSPLPANAGPVLQAFHAAATESHVPRDLMIAIAETEGGLAMPLHRVVDAESEVPVAGPLELRHGAFDSLARGAALTGVTELALRQDSDLALHASARVLAELGARHGASEADLASWSDAIEEMSGYADAAHKTHYAHRVFALLARGGTLTGRDGETIALPAHDLPPHLTLDVTETLHIDTAPADYGPAEWFATPSTNKWTPGRTTSIDFVVIHDTEGGWDASVATLQNDPNKSVHYIVGTDGRVGQFVHEGDTAWHDGNWYYNQRSIGIEHVGYNVQPYPTPQYDASGALVKYLTNKYGIAKDRAHIFGHDQVPNGNLIAESSAPCSDTPANCEASANYGGSGNHRDPGDWEWCIYMVEKVGGTCKCNDIWSLWNCSSDHTEAFRCNGGNVEIEHCNGTGACVSQPNGTDDICNKAASPPDAGAPPPKDAGTTPDAGGAPSNDAGSIRPPPAPTGTGTNGVTPPPPGGASSPAPEAGGCSFGLVGGKNEAWAVPSIGALLLLVAARRRRI